MDDATEDPASPTASSAAAAEGTEQVHNIGKLLRVGGMLREMLDETRRESLDAEARRLAVELLARAITELKGAISPDLQAELDRIHFAFSDDIPSQSQLRLSQAELVGWFEGLFHGMQATLMGQQMGGMPGQVPHPMRLPGQPQQDQRAPGQYL
jgi:hypothetical protein